MGNVEIGTYGDARLCFCEIVAAGFVELPNPALHDFIGVIKLVNYSVSSADKPFS